MTSRKNIDHMDVVKEIMTKAEEEIEKMPPVNILVAGKTGVGKSTLINGLFRANLATTGVRARHPTHRKNSKRRRPHQLYDTRGLELNPKVQQQVKDEIAHLYNQTVGSEDQIFCHLLLYHRQCQSD